MRASGTGHSPGPGTSAAPGAPAGGYRLGEVAKHTGLSPKQLRQWEQHGLVAPIRGTGGQRLYAEADLQRLRQAKKMRDSGMSLAEVKLTLWFLSSNSLGSEVEGLTQIRAICGRIETQLAVVEEITDALRTRLIRRNGRAFASAPSSAP
ncbi:MAG TPA: hypothetical protein DCK98_01460 [Chloroflexi bacterium]|nr:hypothetical protein [Chloroflexota bacterium]HAL25819.1 hypothetical protein [Chloroflexota bacterium]